MMPNNVSSFGLRITTICVLILAGSLTAHAANARSTIECAVYPAVPDGFITHQHQTSRALQNRLKITLENGFISVVISNGVIVSLDNKLTGESYPIESDETGFSLTNVQGQKFEW